jgi:hypothetical protein
VNEDEPNWDSTGYIYFRAAEGKLNCLYRMRSDVSERVKLLPHPILDLQALSPNGRWAIVEQAKSDGPAGRSLAIPLDGGTPVTVCPGYCVAHWSADERSFSVIMTTGVGTETLVAPVSRPRNLPSFPPAGIASSADMHSIPGAKVVDGAILWGPKPGLSASLHHDVHRNLYNVALQ